VSPLCDLGVLVDEAAKPVSPQSAACHALAPVSGWHSASGDCRYLPSVLGLKMLVDRGTELLSSGLLIPDHARLQRLAAIEMPVFAANGDSDPMILPHYSHLLAGMIPHARVTIYPDAAHGFLFQHHAQFAADVQAFLTAPD
jgi:pimeloyl-ACP methyl ester carboxylesterase